jgi:hypothetical protein
MSYLSFLDHRRGLETRLRQAWEEFFELGDWLLENAEKVRFKYYKVENHTYLPDWRDALKDPRYTPRYIGDRRVYFYYENGEADWEVPLCVEAVKWLSHITALGGLIRLDGLYIQPYIATKTGKNRKVKRYFYLKWFGILWGEHIKTEKYEVKRIDKEQSEPRKWEFDKKALSLGYLPVEFDEKIAKKIKTTEDLNRYLPKAKNYDVIKTALAYREVFYLYKSKWKEIQILERLYPILRKKKKDLPYHEWRNTFGMISFGASIVALKRLLDPSWDGGLWFEDWEIFC